MTSEMLELSCKITLLGDGSVGKTSLVSRFVHQTFKTDYQLTLGVNFLSKDVELDEALVNFLIFDLGGQEEFDVFRGRFLQGSVGSLLVFDLTNFSSFWNVSKWLKELGEAGLSFETHPVVLIGNKSDVKKRMVPRDEIDLLIEEHPWAAYIETSAKTGDNVEEAFTILARSILEKAGDTIMTA